MTARPNPAKVAPLTVIELLKFPSAADLASEAARRFVKAVPPNGELLIALSGGRIAKSFYDGIVFEVRERGLNIDRVHFFFADERCVPPTDPESNFLTARQSLFDPLHIRAEQIHRIRGEASDDYAAQEAEAELCRIAHMDGEGQPILDLVILGMGEDGHTASLFPGEPAELMADRRVYRAVTASKPPPRRVTIGYGPLGVAREVWVLASGQGKEGALRQVLSGTSDLPLGRVLRGRSKSLIFSDIAG